MDYKLLSTVATSEEVPYWDWALRNPCRAVDCIDDMDGTGYVDYIVCGGGSNASIWVYDPESTRTYRLFAKLHHKPERPGDALPNVITACAAPSWALIGLEDGRLFAWPLRSGPPKPDLPEAGGSPGPKLRRQNTFYLPAISHTYLQMSGRVSLYENPGVTSISLLDATGFRVATCGGISGEIAIVQVIEADLCIELQVLHRVSGEGHITRSIASVPGYSDLLAACGIRNPDSGSPSNHVWLWHVPQQEEQVAGAPRLRAEHSVPHDGEVSVIKVTPRRNIIIPDLDIDTLQSLVAREGILDELRKTGFMSTGDSIKSAHVFDAIRQALESKVTEVTDDNASDLLLHLGLRRYSPADSNSGAELPWETLLRAIRELPRQLCAVAGKEVLHLVELKPDDEKKPLRLLEEHTTKQELNFLTLDTLGLNAVSVNGKTCSVWRLGDMADGKHASRVPWMELENASAVTAPIRIARIAHGAGMGDQLLCGLDTGVLCLWDTEGSDGGERIAELRSLSYYTEVLLPPILEFVTFVQLASMAFCDSIPWRSSAVVVPRKISNVVTFDLPNMVKITVPRSTVFWAQVFAVQSVMLIFIIIVALGSLELIVARMERIQGSASYAAEKHQMAIIRASYHAKGLETTREVGCAHFVVRLLKIFRSFLETVIKLICTVMVVPLSKTVAQAIDCVPGEGGALLLAKAPDIKCYEGDHLLLCAVLLFLVPAFFLLLLPYAVCGGDATYVQRSELLRPRMWRQNVERKVSSMFMGMLHPKKENYFIMQLVLFAGKALIPVVLIATEHPVFQSVSLVVISWGTFIFFARYPPLVDPKINVIIQGSKLLIAYAMLCASFAIFASAHPSLIPPGTPMLVMGIGSAVLSLCIIVAACRSTRLSLSSLIIDAGSNGQS
mmetsp:Transcript_70708/g.153553  ORF Transcript_70708/g.153553 Transcript_70708/m.153553 type:complete len:898 (-) Transcript_70708:41-2734(-)